MKARAVRREWKGWAVFEHDQAVSPFKIIWDEIVAEQHRVGGYFVRPVRIILEPTTPCECRDRIAAALTHARNTAMEECAKFHDRCAESQIAAMQFARERTDAVAYKSAEMLMDAHVNSARTFRAEIEQSAIRALP